MSDAAVSDLTPVSVERSDGRILTGVGVSSEALQETMERHAPPDEAAEVAATSPTDPAAPAEPKKTRGQRRFDELTGEREAAKREAAAAIKERDELKQRLEALQQPAPVSTPTKADAPAAAAAPAAKFSFPAYDQYVTQHPEASWDDWLEAKTDAQADFKLKQVAPVSQTELEARVRASIEADRASRATADGVAAVIAKGQAVYPDFDAVRAQAGDLPFSPEKLNAIFRDPTIAHDLIYKIAKDRPLAERLSKETDLVQVGVILASLMPSAGAAPLASTSAVGSVNAPAPYVPVGSGSRTTVTPSSELPKKSNFDFDSSGYREARARERGLRGRR